MFFHKSILFLVKIHFNFWLNNKVNLIRSDLLLVCHKPNEYAEEALYSPYHSIPYNVKYESAKLVLVLTPLIKPMPVPN